jgi:hypothetical protein
MLFFRDQDLTGFLQMLTSIQGRLRVITDQHHRYHPLLILQQ